MALCCVLSDDILTILFGRERVSVFSRPLLLCVQPE